MVSDHPSIFILARSLETGGAERQLVHLAEGLKRRGYRVHVVVFYKRGPLIADLEASGVTLIDLRKKSRWDLISVIYRLGAEVRRAKADVIYSFLGGANIVAVPMRLMKRRPRLIWSIRASDMDLVRYGWAQRASYLVERALARVPDLIIANSKAGRDYSVMNGFPQERIKVIFNGVDAERFQPDEARRRAQRGQWSLADNEIAIGVLARFDPMKGHQVFLEAAAVVLKHLAGAKFICIGEGAEEVQIRQLADRLGIAGRVLFPGRSDDPVSALNGLDIYCSSSLYGEGFSNSIAEAMACGLPCVVSDVGDSARIVANCGTIVRSGDPEALAAALLTQAGKLRVHDRTLPRLRILENFSLDRMVDQTALLIDSIGHAPGDIGQ